MCFKSVNIKCQTLFIPVVLIVKPEVGKQNATEQIRAGKDSEVALCFYSQPTLLISFIPQGPRYHFRSGARLLGSGNLHKETCL